MLERDDESPISPPVSAGPIIRDRNGEANEVSTFGIKLQKVLEPRNGGEGSIHSSYEKKDQTDEADESNKKSILEATPYSVVAREDAVSPAEEE